MEASTWRRPYPLAFEETHEDPIDGGRIDGVGPAQLRARSAPAGGQMASMAAKSETPERPRLPAPSITGGPPVPGEHPVGRPKSPAGAG